MKTLGEKAYAATLNTAEGDARGLPVEKFTHKQISDTFGEITELLCISYNTFHQEAIEKGLLVGDEVGVISDDTLLTLGIEESIIENNSLDPQKVGERQVKIAGERPWSFGKGTLAAFDKIRKGVSIQQSGGTTPGNGVMMKQSPVAAYAVAHQLNPEESQKAIDDICVVTHNSPLVRMAAIAHHEFLIRLFNHSFGSIKSEIGGLIKHLGELEKKLGYESVDGPTIKVFMEQLHSRIGEDGCWRGPNTLQEIFDRCNVYWTIIDKTDGKKKEAPNPFHIISTFAICYTLFAKAICEGNIEQASCDAVNIGGDTDSYGAIIGAMIGAYDGRIINERSIDLLIDREWIVRTAKDFQRYLENIERKKSA